MAVYRVAMTPINSTPCAVLGAGSFGTCLALLLAEKGYPVRLWTRDPQQAELINRHRRNPRYLTATRLPDAVESTASLEHALHEAEIIVSVVPSHGVREVWTQALPYVHSEALILSASKGLEVGSGKLVSQVLGDVLPPTLHARLVVLSGPSFAHELAAHQPTSVCVACTTESYAIAAQSILSSGTFRCYSNTDVIGVELGGALKNVMAIAVGCCDGMQLGLNTRAALITRGLAEMRRLGEKLGANPVTFLGLAGVGDLVLTCTGDLSRNRYVGVEIGRGRPVAEVLGSLKQVAEGVRTALSAHELASRHGVEMPITEATYQVLHHAKNPVQAFQELMARQLRSELE